MNFFFLPETHGIRVVSKYSRSKTFDSSLVHGNKNLDCHETKSQCGENRDRCNEVFFFFF